MSSFYGNVPDFAGAFKFLIIMLLVSLPFAMWKLVEIVLWFISHLAWVG